MDPSSTVQTAIDQLVNAETIDHRTLSDHELMDVARQLERVRSLIDVISGRILVELDDRGACEGHRGHTASGWLALEAGVPRAVVRHRMRVARALRDRFGEVEAAVVDGRLSWERARALVDVSNPRVADRLAEIQGSLINLAGIASIEAWRNEVIGMTEHFDREAGHDPGSDLDRNRARVTRNRDGVTVLHAELTGEHAAVATQVLATRADELFRGFQRDHDQTADVEIPGHATLNAFALVDLLRGGLAVTGDTQLPKPEVTVTVWADDPDHGVTEDGQVLPPEVTHLLCCGADRTVFYLDRDLVPLNWARKQRLATPDQRKALKLRDGGCVFPGCDAPPRWCDAHHVHEWDDDGTTDLPNLALLCRRHHRITHRKDWSMNGIGGGWFEWTTPSGQVLRSQRHHRRHPSAA